MIALISGTNRPDSNTRKVTALVEEVLGGSDVEVGLLDLHELPGSLMSPEAYAEKPAEFELWQSTILDADGILSVVPEYNGSFPGIFKYFIDMLRFPESLYEKPAGFIGLSAGRWGALRSIEQLEMIFQYRHAHLFGRRLFLPGIHNLLDQDGRLADPELRARLRGTVEGFVEFTRRLAV